MVFLFIGFLPLITACGKSDTEIDRISEQSYNQGYYDALDCVSRKGGSAESAAKSCENE
jgi:hypothetical protein